jgi:hypothetical protein
MKKKLNANLDQNTVGENSFYFTISIEAASYLQRLLRF